MKAAQRKTVNKLERSLDDLHQKLEAILRQVEAISTGTQDVE